MDGEFQKSTTICKQVLTSKWVIYNVDAFLDGFIERIEVPNFLVSPVGNLTVKAELEKNSSGYGTVYVYVKLTLSRLQHAGPFIRPRSLKAAMIPTSKNEQPEYKSLYFVDFGSSSWIYELQLVSEDTLKTTERNKWVFENKLKITFEIVQYTVRHCYNDNVLDLNDATACRSSSHLKVLPFLQNEQLTDFEIAVKKKSIRVHKIVLAALSPVFAAMFNSNMKEAKEQKVDLTTLDPDVVEEFVFFLYSGMSPKAHTMASDLLVMAAMYQVETLLSQCEEILTAQLTAENAAETLHLAHNHQALKLKNRTKNYIVGNFKAVVATSGWEKMLKDDTRLANEVLQMLGDTLANPPVPTVFLRSF